MNKQYLNFLACPVCGGDLETGTIKIQYDDKIEEGELVCKSCYRLFPVKKFIPRFVPEENYCSNFGLQWIKHSKTQYDSYSGVSASKKRFFEETHWEKKLEGEIILEVGSGSGRFTEQAASTGAIVISIDYSLAVEANYESNGNKENVFIIQGDVFSIPLKKHIADKLFCFGVLQHTPYPEKAFLSMLPFVKKDGKIVVDVYVKSLKKFIGLKYWVRPFTKKSKDPAKQYSGVVNYINFMWPISSVIRKIPVLGTKINWAILVADYTKLGLKGDILKEWAYLDTYDMLSPRYDYPQFLSSVKNWLIKGDLKDIDVHYGYNGIEARGTV